MGENYNSEINCSVITPAVSIDENYINGDQSAQCSTKKLRLKTKSSTQIRVPLIVHDDRREILHTFSKTPVSRHWCTLFCSAVKCLGIKLGFTASATSAVINANAPTI